jgi:ribosome-associated protein
MIRITDRIAIDESELAESFIRSSGPGGQNVNKLSSALQLRFDVRRWPSLPDGVRARLERLAGKRLTREGVIVITAQRHRTQERNRADVRERRTGVKRLRQARPSFEWRGQTRGRPRGRSITPIESGDFRIRPVPCPSASSRKPSSTASPRARWSSVRRAWSRSWWKTRSTPARGAWAP